MDPDEMAARWPIDLEATVAKNLCWLSLFGLCS